ncbi:hypothetical protein CRU92_05360 [Arcobacter sp. FW59]|nr:hypothetical protein CRU92_05360 [Arcobacter sp. FW59]
MFCKECGTENIDTQVECTKCKTIINSNSKLKGIVFRIIAIVLAYLGFVAVKVALVTKGVSFGETTLTSMFVFLAIYKIVVGYSLKIKSSKNMGIWLVVISIILLFLDLR